MVNGIQITIYCNCGWKMSPLDDAISLVMGHIDNGEVATLTENLTLLGVSVHFHAVLISFYGIDFIFALVF